MSIIDVSPEVSIAYESFGDPGDPPVLLVMGFGAQMLAWHEDFCRALADRGRYVIRYDTCRSRTAATDDRTPPRGGVR